MAEVHGDGADKNEGEPAAPNVVWPIKDKEGFYTVPFAYGSIAFWQGKRAPEFQTHRWFVTFVTHPFPCLVEHEVMFSQPCIHYPSKAIPFHTVLAVPTVQLFVWNRF
jgi:hypothetical protein